jgi:hypothetical protein
MKTLNLFKAIYCLLISVMLQSCSNEIGAWKNDQIKQSNRDELHELNAQVFKCLKANDTKSLGAYLSKELLDDNYTNRLAELAGNQLKLDSFVNFNEYYVVNKYTVSDTITGPKQGVNSFHLIYPGMAEEMYIAMFLPKDAKTPNQSMITAVYAHYSYGWKLGKLDIGTYTFNGKTAPELYEQAKQEYKAGYLFSSANTMTLATTCSRPNDIWQYLAEDELYSFNKTATNEANAKYHYPIMLDGVSTGPRIIRVYFTTTGEGSYPTIGYQTHINLKNIDAIKKENAEIRKNIGKVIPGINKTTKIILYSAYNDMPVSTRVVPHYDMKDMLQ